MHETTREPRINRINLICLGVGDLTRSRAFYRDGLGLPTKGIVGREFAHGAVAFFDLSGGLKLTLWAQDDICHDTGLPKQPVSSTAVLIAHNVRRREDGVLEVAGVDVLTLAREFGTAAYVLDEDDFRQRARAGRSGTAASSAALLAVGLKRGFPLPDRCGPAHAVVCGGGCRN